jgi:putative mRNA 3-end processing factor
MVGSDIDPMSTLLETTDRGIYCSEGAFYIDPWQPVELAVITHAHGDHACFGSSHYLTSVTGERVLRQRLGTDARIESVPFGQPVRFHGVSVSLHPAGHVLGSAQVRVEHRGEVWVVSGDYKRERDVTCEPFETVRCHTFITESTFGLPVYRWRSQAEVFNEINSWWRENQREERASVLFAYALGKAQRLLAGIDPSIGPILAHGAVMSFLPAYHAAGIPLPKIEHADEKLAKSVRHRALVIAPPSAAGSPWMRKFAPFSTAFASGWMQLRGARRRRALDRGFALSDHADWDGLLQTIRETGAERVGVTHGYSTVLVRWLRENGWKAWAMPTRYEGEEGGGS